MNQQGMFITPIRSNVAHWKVLQDQGYFENHPWYQGLVDTGGDASVTYIERFLPLQPAMNVVVIGCGYGRETAHIAPRVRHVYGIEVSEVILGKALAYLRERSITNFTPALAESYDATIPDGIDLVYSVVVMQHLTRDLVKDYLLRLGRKLSVSGRMVIQFIESTDADLTADAEMMPYEPSVSWSLPLIAEAARHAGLKFEQAFSSLATDRAFWHWVCLGRPGT